MLFGCCWRALARRFGEAVSYREYFAHRRTTPPERPFLKLSGQIAFYELGVREVHNLAAGQSFPLVGEVMCSDTLVRLLLGLFEWRAMFWSLAFYRA